MIYRLITFCLIVFQASYTITSFGQNSASIVQQLEKLKSPYRVLYLAAHPDDENTKLISYLNREEKARTAYLSLTRGDGGQNLIGDEKGELLGVLRTEELLSARSIDGGEQYFTRAVDFGYSKTSKETFELWDKEAVLDDVVYIIRYFKPHVVINRFPSSDYAGHGHHLASALLSEEAFDKCFDPSVFPKQVEDVSPWRIGTLYFNSSSWWDKSLPERARNDLSIKEINIGTYNKLLGYSYNEEAAFSRSQHKSQGFGSSPTKGDQFEYLEYLKGNFQPESIFHEALLDSIDLKWLTVNSLIDSIIASFNFHDPSNSVTSLLELKNKASLLDTISDRFEKKISDIDQLILTCLGFSIEITSEDQVVNKDVEITLNLKAINRSSIPVNLQEMVIAGSNHSWNRPLDENLLFRDTLVIKLGEESSFSSPYWLEKPFGNRYRHSQSLLQNPDTKGIVAHATISIDGTVIGLEVPVEYKWTDRVKGGLSKHLAVLPEATIDFDKSIYLPRDGLISGNLILRSHFSGDLKGKIVFVADSSLSFKTEDIVSLSSGEIKSVPFEVSFSGQSLTDPTLRVEFQYDSSMIYRAWNEIDYDHIRTQSVLIPAHAKIVPVEFKDSIGKIAYIEGPDNEMIDYLKQAGCDIEVISEKSMLNGELSKYKVLLFGIRSLNVNPNWDNYKEQIEEFMRDGGLVVMQYQTSRGINPIKISPYSFAISRKRVTDEKAKTNISKPNHGILNRPFQIQSADFNNWNQERGLYFADAWEEKFTTVLSWHDPEEFDVFGGLIVGDYGKGAFIYTGISFFRHIPYGVPGSYKLLYNILSYRQD